MSRSLDELQSPHVATISVAGQTIACRLSPAAEPSAQLLLRQSGYMWDPVVSQWIRTISPLTNGTVRDRAIELVRALAAAGWSLNCPDDLRALLPAELI